jgi:hypothetical protein
MNIIVHVVITDVVGQSDNLVQGGMVLLVRAQIVGSQPTLQSSILRDIVQ